MNFSATLHPVPNRGTPPQLFLEELVTFGKEGPDEIFVPNTRFDIYSI